jgi:hypothetical protein
MNQGLIRHICAVQQMVRIAVCGRRQRRRRICGEYGKRLTPARLYGGCECSAAVAGVGLVIGAKQRNAWRMYTHRVIPRAALGNYASRELIDIMSRAEIVWRTTRARPPLQHKKKTGRREEFCGPNVHP